VSDLTTSDMIEKYIKLRDKKEEIQKLHTKQLEPYNAMMNLLEGQLLAQLNAAGLDSMRGDAGTAYRSTHTSVTVKDWKETFDFIRSKELWELLEARVSKTAAMTVMEETKLPIPGVQVRQTVTVRVQRS